MQIVTLRCPNCEGQLEVDNVLETFYCKHCGSKLTVDGMSDSMANARLRLYEMEHESRTQKEKQEHDERELQVLIEHEEWTQWAKLEHKRRKAFMKNALPFALILLMFFISGIAIAFPVLSHRMKVSSLQRIETEIETCITDEDYEGALLKANQLRLDDGYSSEETKSWDARREDYVAQIMTLKRRKDAEDPHKLPAPMSSTDLYKMKGLEAKDMLENAGFTNVALVDLTSPDGGWAESAKSLFRKNGKIESFSFDGLDTFTTEDYFDIDAPIIIRYYSK